MMNICFLLIFPALQSFCISFHNLLAKYEDKQCLKLIYKSVYHIFLKKLHKFSHYSKSILAQTWKKIFSFINVNSANKINICREELKLNKQ